MAGVYVDCRCGCVCVDVCVYPGAQQVVLSPSVYIYVQYGGEAICAGGEGNIKNNSKRESGTLGAVDNICIIYTIRNI